MFSAQNHAACFYLRLCWWLSHSLMSYSCDPMDCSPPGSSVHEISQARILEWVAISFFMGSSWPRNWIWVSCIAGRFFTVWATKEGFFKNWKAYYSFLECYLFFSYERHLEQNSKVVWNRIMPLSPLPIVHSPLNLKYFEYLPQGGIDESFGNSIFNFWRNYHTIFHCGWTILHSQEQCIWVPILLHTHQHLLFVFIIVI